MHSTQEQGYHLHTVVFVLVWNEHKTAAWVSEVVFGILPFNPGKNCPWGVCHVVQCLAGEHKVLARSFGYVAHKPDEGMDRVGCKPVQLCFCTMMRL